MLGWFTWFRENGAPTFYGDNRTPVMLDMQISILAWLFAAPILAYLIILPGIRRHATSSTLAFLINVTSAAVLVISLYHPCWHRAEAQIETTYKSFSREKIKADLMVRVGLQYLNISFTCNAQENEMHYNERFSFSEVNLMENELRVALHKGLPYPILKVIEYLSADGFAWGRQYRVAGYYTTSLLWCAVCCSILAFMCLLFVPHMFSRTIVFVGLFAATGDLIFFWEIPRKLPIRFPAEHGLVHLNFKLSICFHATLFAAAMCIAYGGVLWMLDSRGWYHLETIFSAKRNADDSVVDTKARMSVTSVTSVCTSAVVDTFPSFIHVRSNER